MAEISVVAGRRRPNVAPVVEAVDGEEAHRRALAGLSTHPKEQLRRLPAAARGGRGEQSSSPKTQREVLT
ncbi:MAG TPA: hypothetical protein VGK96_24480 [Candidatus Sulfotelmatobacter sp.]